MLCSCRSGGGCKPREDRRTLGLLQGVTSVGQDAAGSGMCVGGSLPKPTMKLRLSVAPLRQPRA